MKEFTSILSGGVRVFRREKGELGSFLGAWGSRDRVILVAPEYILNALVILLGLPTFGNATVWVILHVGCLQCIYNLAPRVILRAR